VFVYEGIRLKSKSRIVPVADQHASHITMPECRSTARIIAR
jgi:hypothetical protein